MQTQNSQQPAKINEYSNNNDILKSEENAGRFDRLRNAPPSANAAANDSNPANGYKNDPSPLLQPPHHDLQSANAGQSATFKDDSKASLVNSNKSEGSGSLFKQDSATTIGGMKTDAYLHNISADGSGVVTSMHLNRRSPPNGTLSHNSAHDPSKPIVLERHDNSNRSNRVCSQFEYLKPHHEHHDDLGVRMDSSDSKLTDAPHHKTPLADDHDKALNHSKAPMIAGQGKTHEWSFDPSKQRDSEQAPPVGTSVEIKADKKVDLAQEQKETREDEQLAKLEEDTSEKLGSAHTGEKNVPPTAAIIGSNTALAGAPFPSAVTATKTANDPSGDSSLLHANKSGSFNSADGKQQSHSQHHQGKASMWQKITCRSGSKTKSSKHYVSPANVVNHNQGLK